MKYPEQLSFWPNSTSFVLVAVGFAAGLGNIWRYPSLAYQNSGGEFFVAYITLLFLIGLPLLLIEMTIGKKTEKPAPEAFASLACSGAFRFIGYWSLLALLVIISYLSVVMSWSVSFLASALDISLATNTHIFLYDIVLRYRIDDKVILHLFIGSLTLWVFIWFLLKKGTKFLARIVTYITPLPFICLFTLAIYGLFFESSAEGLREFFMIDFTILLNIRLWSVALSQVLFSLMIGFGVLFTYASILRKNVDIVATSKAIILGNALTAFVVSIIMYSTIGHMTGEYHLPAEKVFVENPGMAFVIFAEALRQIPMPMNTLSIVFFSSLLALSVITITLWIKTIISTAREYFPKMNFNVLTLLICAFCFAVTLPYTGSKGIFFLDIMDHFIINYGIVLIAFAEIAVATWIMGSESFRDFVNRNAKQKIGGWYFPLGKHILPGIFFVIIISNLITDFTHPYRGYPADALIKYGVFPAAMIVLGAIILGVIGRHHHHKKENIEGL